jgi:hypothetical protein
MVGGGDDGVVETARVNLQSYQSVGSGREKLDVPCGAEDDGINIDLWRRDRLPEIQFRAFLPFLNGIQIHPRRGRHRKLPYISTLVPQQSGKKVTHKLPIRAPIHVYDFPATSSDLLRHVGHNNLERRKREDADAREGPVVVCCCDRQ